MTHAKYSPSQLHRIITCPGSVSLYNELKPINTSSPYAYEGTVLHGIMEDLINKKMSLWDIYGNEKRTLCSEALEYCVQNGLYSVNSVYHTEVKVALKDLPDVYGTSDVVIARKSDKSVHIMDFKFGGNVKVDCEENPQFYAYAIGAMETLIPTPAWQELGVNTTWRIFVHVIQPRMDNFKAHEVTWYHLKKWQDNVLKPAILNAESDEPIFNPTEEGCRWCLCKARCSACHAMAQEAASTVFSTYKHVEARTTITKEELSAFYKAATALKAHIKAVEEYVLTEALAGRRVPGYKVVHGRANRKWKDETLAARYLTKKYNADPEDLYDTKFKSPAQIEKIFKDTRKDSEFRELTVVPQGAPKLVEETAEVPETNPFSSVTDKKS